MRLLDWFLKLDKYTFYQTKSEFIEKNINHFDKRNIIGCRFDCELLKIGQISGLFKTKWLIWGVIYVGSFDFDGLNWEHLQ